MNCGSEVQCLSDILFFEIRVKRENLPRRMSVRDERDDRCDRNAKSTNAGDAVHLARVRCNPVEGHTVPVYLLSESVDVRGRMPPAR